MGSHQEVIRADYGIQKQQQQQQQYYHRYNNFPSSNLSSYYNKSNCRPQTASTSMQLPHKSILVSSSTPSTTHSSSRSNTSSPSHQEDDFSVIEDSSITSAITLYEVFAAGVSPSERHQNTQLGKGNKSPSSRPVGSHSETSLRMNNDFNSATNYTINELLERQYDDSSDSNDADEKLENSTNSSDGIEDSSSSSCSQQPHDNDEDQQSIFTKYRKRAGALLVSTVALWVYSQLRKSKRIHRQRRGLKNNSDTLRYLLQIISIPVSRIIRRVTQPHEKLHLPTNNKTLSSRAPTWENAIGTPLAHLMALAQSGDVSKVMVSGSALTYLHTVAPPRQSNNSSTQQRQQRWSKTTLPSQNPTIVNEIISTLLQKGCHDIVTMPESLWSKFWNGPAIVALPFAYLAGLYWIMRRLQREQLEDDNGETNHSNSTTNINTATTFADVAGIDSSLQELSEIVSFLRHPDEFQSIGAAPPRGILLHGAPGTGKTLLARAIAGELARGGASDDDNSTFNKSKMGKTSIDAFVVCSGSDFVETYVGRGAARVRALFRKVREDALKNFHRRQRERVRLERISGGGSSLLSRAVSDVGDKIVGAWEGVQSLSSSSHSNDLRNDIIQETPLAIIFIDEVDALAKQRDSTVAEFSSLGGNDEREQTLNQLLTEMDGFKTGAPADNVTVIVIAATNRPHVLDPAILRSGRFDRHVAVSLPDCQGREDILRLHARRIKWDEYTVNFRDIAEVTPQFSGADLKCLINEAALLAVRNGSRMVQQTHLVQAAQKLKKSSRSSSRQRFGGSLHY